MTHRTLKKSQWFKILKNKENIQKTLVVIPPQKKQTKTKTKKKQTLNYFIKWGASGIANVQDCDIVVGKFELQSRYYINFHTDVLKRGWPEGSLFNSYNTEVYGRA